MVTQTQKDKDHVSLSCMVESGIFRFLCLTCGTYLPVGRKELEKSHWVGIPKVEGNSRMEVI